MKGMRGSIAYHSVVASSGIRNVPNFAKPDYGDDGFFRELEQQVNPMSNSLPWIVVSVMGLMLLVCIFYFCFQIIRATVDYSRGDSEDEMRGPSEVVRDCIIAHLTPRQRRAILETFFSDSSKVLHISHVCCASNGVLNEVSAPSFSIYSVVVSFILLGYDFCGH